MNFSQPATVAPSLLQRVLSAVLGFAIVIGGALLMLAALLLGLVVASGVVLWALLRGRRPEPVNLRWGQMPRPRGFGPRATDAREVVDVQVREVDEPPSR